MVGFHELEIGFYEVAAGLHEVAEVLHENQVPLKTMTSTLSTSGTLITAVMVLAVPDFQTACRNL